MERYDYIICGAGCAGLSLAYRLCDESFIDKKILILEKSPKNKDDRTWSFWIDKSHLFDSIVHKRWSHINFYGDTIQEKRPIEPYTYQTIKGIDFYNYTLRAIDKTKHIDIRYEAVTAIKEHIDEVQIETDSNIFIADKDFNSIVPYYPEQKRLFVWQHYKGWIIEGPEGTFDPDTATFMDFRIAQEGETRFVYVLPYSNSTALVEATIFSKLIWEPTEYDELLKNYIDAYLHIKEYKVLEEEVGAIPMTTARFNQAESNHVIPIGTLNDTVKPSSGYAFWRIQEESEEIVAGIRKDQITRPKKNPKFIAYDKTLLDVVINQKQTAKKVFSLMFKHSTPQEVFKFLNEKTNVLEEGNIFRHLPIWSFLTSFVNTNVLRRTK